MKLSELMEEIELFSPYHDCEVREIRNNSKLIEPGDLYVAIPGTNVDGHQFVADALKRGACGVVVSRDMGVQRQLLVKDTKKAYALLCAAFFGYPSRETETDRGDGDQRENLHYDDHQAYSGNRGVKDRADRDDTDRIRGCSEAEPEHHPGRLYVSKDIKGNGRGGMPVRSE